MQTGSTVERHPMSSIIETPREQIGSAPAGAAPAYTMTARVLHWITAVAILLMLPLGWASANEWGGAWQDWLYDLHRSIGAALIHRGLRCPAYHGDR